MVAQFIKNSESFMRGDVKWEREILDWHDYLKLYQDILSQCDIDSDYRKKCIFRRFKSTALFNERMSSVVFDPEFKSETTYGMRMECDGTLFYRFDLMFRFLCKLANRSIYLKSRGQSEIPIGYTVGDIVVERTYGRVTVPDMDAPNGEFSFPGETEIYRFPIEIHYAGKEEGT